MGKGKTYFVSGCSRGVGLALAKELLSQPDERIVFAAARSPHKSEELQKLAKENKDRLHIITFDVTDGNSAKVKSSETLMALLALLGNPMKMHYFPSRVSAAASVVSMPCCRKLQSKYRKY